MKSAQLKEIAMVLFAFAAQDSPQPLQENMQYFEICSISAVGITCGIYHSLHL